MSADLLAPPSSQPPRTSTPLGPHSTSPEKKPPSPFEQLSRAGSSTPMAARNALGRGLPSPSKASSIESNFSSVQGKTAGSSPGDDQQTYDHFSDSSIWEENEVHVLSAPTDNETATPKVSQVQSRPDWMTEELDESWPDPEQTPKDTAPTKLIEANTVRLPDATLTEFKSMDPANSSLPTRTQLPSVTPSSSRLVSTAIDAATTAADPAFSVARRQARRALLKPPTPSLVARVVSSDPSLQAGPSTPSMRIPSHLRRRNNLNDISDTGENSDSTVWSESDSEPESAVADDYASARGSLRENSRVTNIQQPTAQVQSPASSSTGSALKVTFIHRADVSSLPPVLRPVWQSPAKGPAGANRKGIAGIGGDMFTPMRLQTMFKTPTPPRPLANMMGMLAAPTAEAEAQPPVEAPAQISSQGTSMISVPSTAFTFQSAIATQPGTLRGTSGLVPSKSLQDIHSSQTPHATTSTRPASAAANLGMLAIPVPIDGALLSSAPPTPHTPMRLFKFNYDGAVARAKLEEMVSENSPAATKTIAPLARADVERERKRLRLDIKPRKVITGDLMQMPSLVSAAPPISPVQADRHADNANPAPIAGDADASVISFHQGSVSGSPVRSPVRSRLSPVRPRRLADHAFASNIAAAATEHQSPQRVSARKLPLESTRSQRTTRDAESPRKILRRISASAMAEDEVMQEMENESHSRENWVQSVNTLVQRDQQIRELEERIARRRQQRHLSSHAAGEAQPTHDLRQPRLITIHEPTQDSIQARSKAAIAPLVPWDGLDEEEEEDSPSVHDAATRRFQDGIVLYDSERNLAPPQTDQARTLRNVASEIELRNRGANGRVKQSTLLALPSHTQVEAPVHVGENGVTITRSGSLFNISQIPDEQVQNLGRGKLTFNKELNKWEKVPRTQTSHEDLRSAASSRNGVENARNIKTPVPSAIPEASVETSRDEDVFSDTIAERDARTQPDAVANAFQQRLSNLSASNPSFAEGKSSDSSDPFRNFESFGQNSSTPEAVLEEQPVAVEEQAVFPNRAQLREQARQERAAKRMDRDEGPAVPAKLTTSGVGVRQTFPARSPAARVQASTNVPRSGSSLRNVVTYSPDSTVSSQQSNISVQPEQVEPTEHHARTLGGGADLMSTPDRRVRPVHQHAHPMTPTPIASASFLSTPKSILKQADRVRAPHVSAAIALGESTPNRTISFADSPPRASRNSAPGRAELESARSTTESGGDVGDDRTEAISSALRALAELTLGDENSQLRVMNRGATPSRHRDAMANRSHWSYRTLQRPRKIRHHEGEGSSEDYEDDGYDELHGYPDMTLLTDASFNLAHDRILEAITDVEPWEPGWDELQTIDLNGRRLESCVRLKEFLPALEELNVYQNELSYLTGVPTTLRVLNARANRLTDMASFGHLLHLEELDISDNQIESLTHLSCLKHLHTLKADRNGITSLSGIDKLRSLTHVSLSGNGLRGINLNSTHWVALESLDVSHNALVSIRGLSSARRLKSLNLDYNDLAMVDLTPSLPRLRVLRVSGNVNLSHLDVLTAPKLRTLYADYCNLTAIESLDTLQHLDNLSMRQQVEASIVWPASQLRDIRRLFLSGNAFPSGIQSSQIIEADAPIGDKVGASLPATISMRFLNMVYLELSACQLTQLPHDLAEMAPNLRSLNLDHNLISTLPDLSAMQRLKRLSLVGCRVKRSKSVITAVRGMTELQVIDTRTNPCTLGLYAPYVVSSSISTQNMVAGSAAASLPPIPNAHLVQPDRAAAARRQAARQKTAKLEVVEKSFFHKRQRPATDYAVANDAVAQDDGPVADMSTLFAATDARFVKTLPRQFLDRRTLHRGLLAMGCPKLDWIDGLLITDLEIEAADDLVNSRRFDRTP